MHRTCLPVLFSLFFCAPSFLSHGVQAATLGNATVGSQTDSGDSNFINAIKFSMPNQSGTVTSMSVYIGSTVSASPNNKFQVAIYANADGSPGSLIASSQSNVIIPNAWNNVSVSANLLANTFYWLAFNTNGTSPASNNFRMGTGATGQMKWRAQPFGSWPAIFGAVSGSAPLQASIYATYSTGSTPTPPVSTPDTQAPSVPSGIRATNVSSTQINLSWSASTDNVGVSGYRVLRAGSQIGTVMAPTTSYSNTGLSPSTSYTYTVVAYDAAGNVSQSSIPVISTTLSGDSGFSLSINGNQKFQTIDGFGVSVNAGSWNNGELRPALDMLVDQLGATLFRVIIDNADWEARNDNADPNSFDWTYYNTIYTSAKFENLWNTIGYLNQKGITSGIVLNFMGPVARWMGGTNINVSAEDEWVEMIASLVFYAKNSRGLRFSLLAPMNEPAWDGIEGPLVWEVQYARLMQKLATKLDKAGLSDIRFVGPDTASSIGGFTPFFHELVRNPNVMAKLDHFAFHDYGSGNVSQADVLIKSSAYPNKNFWVTEVANIGDAFPFIGQGAAAYLVWEGYESVYNHAILAGRGTTPPNDLGNGPALLGYNRSSGVYTPVKAFHEHRQVFKFLSPGTVRVGAQHSIANLTVYAFQHPLTGRLTIVGRNTSNNNLTLSVSLANLPLLSHFEIYRTNSSLNFQRGSDVLIANGSFTTTVSANTIFTLSGIP